MYADVTVVVDGALEASEVFTDYLLLEQFIKETRQAAEDDGYPTEVYILEHDHSPSVEDCCCAQYATDHHPTYTFPESSATV